jgi:hypothetical protein
MEPRKAEEAYDDPDLQGVWKLVPRPHHKKTVGTRWVFRNKMDEDDVVTRIKARLVAKEFSQVESIDFDETYAPVARIDIRYHLIREHVMNGTVELLFVPTEEQIADIFTKALDVSTFTRLVGKLGMLNSPSN